MEENNKEKDNYNYKGWLTSESHIKRSFRVLGYFIAGYIYVGLIILAIMFFLAAIQMGIGQ